MDDRDKTEFIYRLIGNADDKFVDEMLDDGVAAEIRRKNAARRRSFYIGVMSCAAAAAMIVGLGVFSSLGNNFANDGASYNNNGAGNKDIYMAAEADSEDLTGDEADGEFAELEALPDKAENAPSFEAEASDILAAEGDEMMTDDALQNGMSDRRYYSPLGSIDAGYVGEPIEYGGGSGYDIFEINGVDPAAAAAVMSGGADEYFFAPKDGYLPETFGELAEDFDLAEYLTCVSVEYGSDSILSEDQRLSFAELNLADCMNAPVCEYTEKLDGQDIMSVRYICDLFGNEDIETDITLTDSGYLIVYIPGSANKPLCFLSDSASDIVRSFYTDP